MSAGLAAPTMKLYRANFLPRLLRPRPRHTRCPVQVIIPTRDAYVGRHLTEHLVHWTGKLTLQELDAPHWAPPTEPDAICQSVGSFVTANR
jgi:pimeloyl-ACP methyl ester carboxylesterase